MAAVGGTDVRSQAQAVRRGPALLVLVCAVLFAALATTVGVRHGAPLPGDRAAHDWALRHRPPVAQALGRGITASGTGVWPYLIVLVAGLIAGRDTRERVRAVGCALAVLIAGQLVRTGLMELFARARPPVADWAVDASGFAFPSGHATTSALTAGLLCWAVTRHARPDLARTTCVVAVAWAAAVGLSRVYLGVHWASDVLGGWLLAAVWLGLSWWWLGRWLPSAPAGGDGRESSDTAPEAEGPTSHSGPDPAPAPTDDPSQPPAPAHPAPPTPPGPTPSAHPASDAPADPPPTSPHPPTEDHAPQDPGR